MNIEEKKQVVKSLKEDFAQAQAVLLTHYSGLTVEQITNLRVLARNDNISVKIAKNSLIKFAIEDSKFDNLNEHLNGPTLLIYADDIVSLTKLVVNFAKDNEFLKIKVGSYNDSIIDVEEVTKISKMLSLDEIRSKLIGLIQAPASKVACVIQAPASNCARVIKAYSKK